MSAASQLLLVEDPRDCWRTPRPVFEELNAIFNFRRDLAASDDYHLCDEYYTRERSSLCYRPWGRIFDGWSFLNPPFSKLPIWVEAAIGARVVVALPANRTGREWFHDFVLPHAVVAFKRGPRIQYEAPPGVKKSSCGFDTMLAIYGPMRRHLRELRVENWSVAGWPLAGVAGP